MLLGGPRKREMFLDQLSEKIEAYYYGLDRGYAPLTRSTMIGTIVSFFKHNRIPISPDLNERLYVKYHNRDISREEITRILEHASLRDRTFFIDMAESGQRPHTLVQLRYRHIREEFEAGRIPMKIDLPAELIKDRVGHRFTFIGEDGFHSLKEYLAPRMPLDDETLLFKAEKPGRTKREFLCPETFGNAFSKIALNLGLTKRVKGGKPKPLRLYCLRKYFRNNIRIRDEGYRKFWMGRAFGTDEHYLTRDVETHRKEYAAVYPNIRILQPNIPETIEELRSYYEEKLQKQRTEIITLLHDELSKEWEGLLEILIETMPKEHRDKLRAARDRQLKEFMKGVQR